MIGYTTVGTNDLERSGKYFDALLGELGASRLYELDRGIAWTVAPGEPFLFITKPFDGEPATVGNGMMIALKAGSREKVDKIHAKALELGSPDEGAPGERAPTFYGAYFRDLDGNKFCVFHAG